MVGLLHAMAFMVLLLIGWVIWNNKTLPLPWANVKPHVVKTFCRRFWFKSHMLLRDRFIATSIRFLALWKRKKTCEPWTYQLQPFGCVLLDVFCSCVWHFCIHGKRVATWSTRCALTSLCRHSYVQGVCFFEYREEKSDVKLIKP